MCKDSLLNKIKELSDTAILAANSGDAFLADCFMRDAEILIDSYEEGYGKEETLFTVRECLNKEAK